MSQRIRRIRSVAAATLLVVAASACASLPPAHTTASPGSSGVGARGNAAPGIEQTIWYATNRARDGSDWKNERAAVSHGVRRFAVRPLRSDSVSFEVRLDVQTVRDSALTSHEFFDGLAQAVAALGDSTEGVLLHVHGYSTPLHDAAEEAAEMRTRGGSRGPMMIFSWPANASGITWPSRQHLFTQAYWQDSVQAARSAPDLARVLRELVDAVGAHRVVVSSHSMGAQVLAAALQDSALRRTLSRTPLRAIAFVSPDVDREQFVREVVPSAEPLAGRVALYASRNDVLLRISGVVHDGRPRAGALRDSASWPTSLEVIDITDGRRSAFWLGPWLDTNHALRRQGGALVDLFSVLVSDAPPGCREQLGETRDGQTGVWKLRDAPLPERALFSASSPTPASLHTLPQCA